MKDPFYLIFASVVMGIVLLVILFPIQVHDTAMIVPSKPSQGIFQPADKTTENVMQDVSQEPECVKHIQNQTIGAGYFGDYSCPAGDFFTSTKIIKASGFYGIYYNSTNERSDTYALEPRREGTITYAISGHAMRYEGSIPPDLVIKNQTEISNVAEYVHHQNITVPQTVQTLYHVESNGSKVPYYWACHQTAVGYPNGGIECYGGQATTPPADHITMDTMMFSHPGIDLSYKPQSEIIHDNQTVIVSATISATSDAPTGTYWIILAPGKCNGGQVLLLEVTKCGDEK